MIYLKLFWALFKLGFLVLEEDMLRFRKSRARL